jgi:hypothetical protein
MEPGNGTEQVEPAPRRGAAVFVAALVLYYVVYYVVFAGRLGGYFSDVLKHFHFVRRLL